MADTYYMPRNSHPAAGHPGKKEATMAPITVSQVTPKQATDAGALDGFGFSCSCGGGYGASLLQVAKNNRAGHIRWHQSRDEVTK